MKLNESNTQQEKHKSGYQSLFFLGIFGIFSYNLQFTILTFVLYFQLKCPKPKIQNVFEIDLISGTYTSGWRLCGLRLFQGGKFILLRNISSFSEMARKFQGSDK